jgi:hypothetical protein
MRCLVLLPFVLADQHINAASFAAPEGQLTPLVDAEEEEESTLAGSCTTEVCGDGAYSCGGGDEQAHKWIYSDEQTGSCASLWSLEEVPCYKKEKAWSETLGKCVELPWSDFSSCFLEVIEEQGETCDSNEWVKEHCQPSCRQYVIQLQKYVQGEEPQCFHPWSEGTSKRDAKASKVGLLFLIGDEWPQRELWEQFIAPIRNEVTVHVHTTNSSLLSGTSLGRMFPAALIQDAKRCKWYELQFCFRRLLEAALQDPKVESFAILGPKTIPLKTPQALIAAMPGSDSKSRFCFFSQKYQGYANRPGVKLGDQPSGAVAAEWAATEWAETHQKAALFETQTNQLLFKTQAWFTMVRRHAEAIVSYFNSNETPPGGDICRNQRFTFDAAGEEVCFIRILHELGVLGEVEDKCDMFLWWWEDDGTLWGCDEPQDCSKPMYCNHSLYLSAATPLLDESSHEKHHINHPVAFDKVSKRSLQALIASPFLFARKFEGSKDLTQHLVSLFELG